MSIFEASSDSKVYEKTVSRINPNLLLLKIIYKTHEHYNLLIETKWNYLQKIIKGPASLSVAHDRNVCMKRLIKFKSC